MNDYKVILGSLAVLIGFVGYVPYIRDVLRGKTNPHVFSWFLWGVMETIAFFAQISKGGGSGAWVTGTGALIAFFVAILALKRKDKQIVFFDWVALAGAVVGIILWQITNNPLMAIIFVTIADALAFIPTFRKSYSKPHEETLFEYGLSGLKWIFGIFALSSLNLTTWLYPASLIATNFGFIIMALIRRRQLQK
jgi:hypothetical protein